MLSVLAPAQVDLWLARESPLREPALLEKLGSVLPADQHARLARLKIPEVRHQQLITRAMERLVLSHYLPAHPPASWRFERGELGRPSIARDMPAEARQLHFNLAHTPGLVVMAVGLMPELGVDAERIAAKVPLNVARSYFSVREIAALDALPDDEKPRRFQRLWTLKESYLKAVGTGIQGGLDSMTFHFEPGVRFEHESNADAAYWQFREITVDEEYLVTVACLERGSSAPLQMTLFDFSGQE